MQWPVTAALLVSFVVIFVATAFDPDRRLLAALCKDDARIRGGEVWRLLTASFVHSGLAHLLVNSIALASIGSFVERHYGSLRFLLVFVVTGAVAIGTSAVFEPMRSGGASGALLGIVGVLVGHAVLHHRAVAEQLRRRPEAALLAGGAIVAFGLLTRGAVDTYGHVGGFVGGLALGLVVKPREPLFRAERTPEGRGGVSLGIRAGAVATGPTRRSLAWAGQRWRMVAWNVLSVVAVGTLMTGNLGIMFIGAALSLGGCVLVARTRCPGCEARVVWWAMRKLPAGQALAAAFGSEACPLCGYPDTRLPGLRTTGRREDSSLHPLGAQHTLGRPPTDTAH